MKILGLSKCVQMQKMEEHIGIGYFKDNIPEKKHKSGNKSQNREQKILHTPFCVWACSFSRNAYVWNPVGMPLSSSTKVPT